MKREAVMKKLFCLTLAILMSILLVSCGKSVTTSKSNDFMKVITDGKTEYEIVRGDSDSENETQAAIALRKGIKEKTKIDIKLSTDWVKKGEKIPVSKKEILIGKTNRTESVAALKKLEKRKNNQRDFAIVTTKERIVITATAKEGLDRAVAYFLKNNIVNGKIEIPENTEYYDTYKYKK